MKSRSNFDSWSWAPLQQHVRQADVWLLLWLYILQVSLGLVTYKKLVATHSPWRLVVAK